MNNALIIHGMCDKEEYFSDAYPSLSNSHWLPWLQKQLLIRNISTQTPEMPEAYHPDYNRWSAEFERFDINPGTILIGHSCGVGFLVRWLSEHKQPVAKLVSVAPWMDSPERRLGSFFEFTIDKDLAQRVGKISILFSKTEIVFGVREAVELIRKELPLTQVNLLDSGGHFTREEMGTDKFPELLDMVLQ
ncbi:MAG: hypothetical protein UX65_C0003G0005 [Parcubacteria group bacterium GW2011_GWB1_46_8]|nr:MAG: hypothetical protein UX14_C0025G0004 [Parcubacteria group bacterium GW2011_GWF1_45_5]KKU10864.1 MAG: hypothetical protein UX15_C0020G0003 [Parcubacteria group bacterium GW2011_GWA1_45_7]KKU46462.1 MAG: hypothetical protein UX65_C0003G0005 [Parcubacteria group bacterium GW2011_GWB1_46_8]OGJ05218.1 MAG: hypothetical protein A2357_01015 [Candidatus Nomurabacteria bacterium RIFOXYB1_FULL_43_14]